MTHRARLVTSREVSAMLPRCSDGAMVRAKGEIDDLRACGARS
jgi:hypothetical protein